MYNSRQDAYGVTFNLCFSENLRVTGRLYQSQHDVGSSIALLFVQTLCSETNIIVLMCL
jgi:hypothetical protein